MSRLRFIAIVLALIAASGFALRSRPEPDRAVLFDQVFSLVSQHFLDSAATGALYEKAARGLVHELHDPYAELIAPRDTADFAVQTAGHYGGVGLLIEEQDGHFTVTHVYPHTPGEEAGVASGDRITAVNGLSTAGWEFARVTRSMKGLPGSTVDVTFQRPGVTEPIVSHITRALVRVPSVPYAIMLNDAVGYVPLQQFSERSRIEVETAVGQLLHQGARGLILDLRGNGGGYLDQALQVTNLFLEPGQVMATVRYRATGPEIFRSRERPLAPTTPLVILTDGGSASASEIVAGALQDHDRALVVGTTSYGKGLVQTSFPLSGGYLLKITTGTWYTPSGRSIQKPGRFPSQDDDGATPAPVVADSGSTAGRPAFRSAGGRTVYGGGAITPDLVVPPDSLLPTSKALLHTLASKGQESHLALYDLAMAARDGLRPDFTVSAAWREDLYGRLKARGVEVDRREYDAAAPFVSLLIADQLARVAFGDSTAKRRGAANDHPLAEAVRLLTRARSQEDLLVALRRDG